MDFSIDELIEKNNSKEIIYGFDQYLHLPTGFLLVKDNGDIMMANQYAARVFRESTIEGKNIDDLAHTSDQDQYPLKEYFKLKKQKGVFNMRLSMAKRKSVWVQCHVQVLDVFQKVFLVYIQDITNNKRLNQLFELHDFILKLIVKGASLTWILNSLNDKVEEYFQKKAFCSIAFVDESKQEISSIVAPKLPDHLKESLQGLHIGPGVGGCGTAMYRKETVISSNILEDGLWDERRHILLNYNIKSCWSTPIVLDGQLLGAFTIYFDSVCYPTGSHMKFIHTCSQLLSVAVERSQTIQGVKAESEEKLRFIDENTTDMIGIIDRYSMIQFSSPSFKERLGYAEHEFIGQSFLKYVHTDDYQKVLEVFDSLLELEKTVTFQYLYLHKDGHYLLCETIAKSVKGLSGEIESIVVNIRDITERRQMEKDLAFSKKRFQSLFENHPNAVLSIDLDGKVTNANPSFIQTYGYTLHEIIGETLDIIVKEKDSTQVLNYLTQALVGETQKFEIDTIAKDSSIVVVNGTLVPINVDENIVGVFVDLKDVTEQKKTDELLRESDKLSVVGQLAAGIVHEIRNPLTTLKGFTQLIETGEAQPEFFKIIKSEIDRIEHIVSEYLTLSKPKIEEFQDKNLIRIIQDVVTMLQPQATLRGIQMNWKMNNHRALVHCAENQLKQVFINIIKNAFEAMDKGGTLTFEAIVDDDFIDVSFIDTGDGIPTSIVNKIGQPFYTTKESGTGLGLMICKQILEQHEGRMAISSEVGRGTTISVILPLSRGDEK